MGSQPPTYERRVDRDGVTHIQRKRTGNGVWIVGLALGFTVVCLLLSAWLVSSPGPVADTAEAAPVRVAENTSPPPSRPAPKVTTPAPQPATQPQPQGTPAQAEPTPQQAPATPEAAPSGPAEGINLYRPGTKPIKQGIVVPEDFELPPGYVRHYQATDNGERVKPILMFHPDYKPVDSNGKPVELPSNRVVPPEMAPPGMPIEILDVPTGPEGVEPIP
ncbi:hypothetical protein [Vitiosangium sp. GDMCC 1.1324]|uniref:hypothetical protein n=1 Tax=Vitiosangium sp. (strain GDMCC 1.1324) TaxID=2138576 RepID=UPI000D34A427|nr:hypothetical protein [Vitiosangium sp. GDMCC 1.1324]PTL85443.1 hypothetical protein DAT35_01610 [Vitiosangium sp. GDMCC 1.1324]